MIPFAKILFYATVGNPTKARAAEVAVVIDCHRGKAITLLQCQALLEDTHWTRTKHERAQLLIKAHFLVVFSHAVLLADVPSSRCPAKVLKIAVEFRLGGIGNL